MSRPASYCRPGEDDPSLATVNMLIYSHPGEGKTVLWGTGGRDVLFMVSDPEGIISARGQGHMPHSVQVTDYEELQECYEWLKQDRPKDFKWIVWDSLTLFQDRVLIDDLMPDAIADNPNQDEFVPSQRQYLQNMNRIGRYVRQFVDLPYNFGISCHVMTTTESGGDGTIFMPQVQGKNMPSKIAGYCNVVGYMGKRTVDASGEKKVVQTIQFQRQGRIYAKDRFGGCLGTFMDRPTLPKIDAAINKWRAEMKARQQATPSAQAVKRAPVKATATKKAS